MRNALLVLVALLGLSAGNAFAQAYVPACGTYPQSGQPVSGSAVLISGHSILCPDGVSAAVWATSTDLSNPTPASFDLNQLDQGQITSYFTWGWFIVFLGWATGKGVSVFIKFLKSV